MTDQGDTEREYWDGWFRVQVRRDISSNYYPEIAFYMSRVARDGHSFYHAWLQPYPRYEPDENVLKQAKKNLMDTIRRYHANGNVHDGVARS